MRWKSSRGYICFSTQSVRRGVRCVDRESLSPTPKQEGVEQKELQVGFDSPHGQPPYFKLHLKVNVQQFGKPTLTLIKDPGRS